MTRDNPFELPDDVVDAAMAQFVDVSAAERERAMAALIARFPAHGDGLRALGKAIADADRALGTVFCLPGDEPSFDGYRVLRRLGEGAFGVVYLCEQSEPIRRQVAVKLLRAGAGNRNTLRRFEAERRFLARLRHPAIAQIHDAGALADGRPWFVMEYVDGVPITTWCDAARLPLDARLRLFVRLCHGVQHAHEHGIVHRDLKPSNVLVLEIDGEAQPKIIDFGIARALQPTDANADGPPRTEAGGVVGSPGYMSPEQEAGRLDEVDARSDVWSLGVLLFELLTGTLPFGDARTSTDTDAVPPSRRLGSDPERAGAIAEQRGTDGRRLAAMVRGELDWIVGRALARERNGRYASVLDLAADVSRHLRGDSVHAGPPSWRYRARKFARRHRVALTFVVTAGVLAGGAGWMLSGFRARTRASVETADAAVRALIARANDATLVSSAPNVAAARQALAADALAFYDRFLRERPADPELLAGRAYTLTTLSQVHFLLGDAARSEQLVREAIATYDALLADNGATAGLQRAASLAYRYLGRCVVETTSLAAARPQYQRSVDLLEAAHQREPSETVALLVEGLRLLARTLEPEEAETLLARAQQLQQAECEARPDDAAARDLLGQVLVARGGLGLARDRTALARQCLERAAALDAQHPLGFEVRCEMLRDLAALATDGPQAVAAMQRIVEAARAWLAAEPQRLAAHGQATLALLELAKSEEAHGMPWQATAREAAAVADAWIERFPKNPIARQGYCLAVEHLCEGALQQGRRADLLPLEPLVRRACERIAPAPDLPEAALTRRLVAWQMQGLLGFVADALGQAEGEAIWNACAAMLQQCVASAPLSPETVVVAIRHGNRIARRLLSAGRTAEADSWLERLDDWYRAPGTDAAALAFCAPDTALLRTIVALQRGEWAAAERAAEAAGLASEDWRAAAAAAEAMSLVWIAARDAGAAHAGARDRALASCDAALELVLPLAVAAPLDPRLTLQAQALRIRRALAIADREGAVDAPTLRAALEAYAALEPTVHADAWDAGLYEAGRRLIDR